MGYINIQLYCMYDIETSDIYASCPCMFCLFLQVNQEEDGLSVFFSMMT